MNAAPLIVHTDWSCAWGGQEIRMLTELREMKKLGFRVAMIVRRDSELARRGRQEDIPVYFIDFSSKFNLSAWHELFCLIKRLKPAVINTHSSEDSWMAGCVGRLCRVPLIIKTRHVLAPISSSFSYNVFADVVFACSEAIGEQLAAQGVARRKIVIQSTGIDEERFRFSEQERAEIRSRYKVARRDILVGNVAFLRHYKGHDFIVRTAATMPANYKFMIVGGGNGCSLLKENIARAGVEDRFILTGHREDPERFFSAMDIIFFSSYETEGISQSFIQGLLYGIPLLTCRTPSILEPLEHVRQYRVIEYNDLDAARSGLLDLARHLDRDRHQVEQQRLAISEKYGLRTMVKTIVRTYGEHGIRVEH
jgi:glycosyltransferase involved in cell wall biosynthesis